ncbi:MAG TPA: hypothetical protein VEV83_15455 [Parafilimonas sp.]|nr:hypothetical protein [Parafilimonas sp.]
MWWWEIYGDKDIYVDDLADYREYLALVHDRQRMKQDMDKQKAEAEAKRRTRQAQ